MADKRTIETILNLVTGEITEVEELFKDPVTREAEIFQLRTKIEKNIQTNTIELVCIYCKQAVAIRGRKRKEEGSHFFFAHPFKSQPCIIKTDSRFTEDQIRRIKFNGAKESDLHNKLKGLIGHYLNEHPDVHDVKIDEVYRNKAISHEWRKPDVLAVYKNHTIAFELQLSTTFLSVVVGRTLFYQNQNVFLIWIFANFSLTNDLQKFTQKDVFYNNNFNVYVFDQQAWEKSKLEGQLILHCFYQVFYIEGEQVLNKWEERFITIDQLTFELVKTDVFYIDAEKSKAAAFEELGAIKQRELEEFVNKRNKFVVERAIKAVRQCYKWGYVPGIREYDPFDEIDTPERIELLNEQLGFSTKNVDFVAKLFYKREKPDFLKFLCLKTVINIDTTLLANDGKNIFEELHGIDDLFEFKQYITFLFSKGYKLTEKDRELNERIYDKNYWNQSDHEKEQIHRWGYVLMCSEVISRNLMFDLLNKHRIIFAIASVKHDILISYGYDTLKQLVHHILDRHKDYGVLFIQALEKFDRMNLLLAEDKKGKLRAKIEAFNQNISEQESRYNQLIFEIFPELYI
ncbi:DUF6035 family protein [Mucilaginibacter aquatilis]|uniref:Competence protein CoiA-like protein n=1 Tax=Mucilaginibacter aquatilis TaxID=1517760 RepID=A0A6I4IGK7_9SPHI|nr:DUF6035 family protein [Mucilaginibacter aquatilis]MVN92676.1 hypothetical protein [Mucilaginibacter aquatilis]